MVYIHLAYACIPTTILALPLIAKLLDIPRQWPSTSKVVPLVNINTISFVGNNNP